MHYNICRNQNVWLKVRSLEHMETIQKQHKTLRVIFKKIYIYMTLYICWAREQYKHASGETNMISYLWLFTICEHWNTVHPRPPLSGTGPWRHTLTASSSPARLCFPRSGRLGRYSLLISNSTPHHSQTGTVKINEIYHNIYYLGTS